MRTFMLIVVGLALIGVVGQMIAKTDIGQRAWLAAAPSPPAKPDPLDRVTIAAFHPRLDLGIVSSDFTIANDNPFPVRDISVSCQLKGASGTVINEGSATIFDVVPAKSRKSFKDLTLGIASRQTKNLSCSVVNARI